MGRPSGRFDQKKEECFKIVADLANHRIGGAVATTRWLSLRLKVSQRQVKNYLSALDKEGRITRETSGYQVDLVKRKYYRKRVINISNPTQIHPPHEVQGREEIIKRVPTQISAQILEAMKQHEADQRQELEQLEIALSTPGPESLMKEYEGLDLHKMLLSNMGELDVSQSS